LDCIDEKKSLSLLLMLEWKRVEQNRHAYCFVTAHIVHERSQLGVVWTSRFICQGWLTKPVLLAAF